MMHWIEMNHWLWTWEAWRRIRYGLMERAYEDTDRRIERGVVLHKFKVAYVFLTTH